MYATCTVHVSTVTTSIHTVYSSIRPTAFWLKKKHFHRAWYVNKNYLKRYELADPPLPKKGNEGKNRKRKETPNKLQSFGHFQHQPLEIFIVLCRWEGGWSCGQKIWISIDFVNRFDIEIWYFTEYYIKSVISKRVSRIIKILKYFWDFDRIRNGSKHSNVKHLVYW